MYELLNVLFWRHLASIFYWCIRIASTVDQPFFVKLALISQILNTWYVIQTKIFQLNRLPVESYLTPNKFLAFLLASKRYVLALYISLFHQVCEGDSVIVNVVNNLQGAEGTSIHWHGVLQHDSQHMDGVSMVTQCAIPASSSFEYKYVFYTVLYKNNRKRIIKKLYQCSCIRRNYFFSGHIGRHLWFELSRIQTFLLSLLVDF